MSSAAWKIVFCVAMLTLVGTALAVYRASRLLGPTNAEAERRDEDARNSAWRHPQFENVDEAALMFGRLVKAANRRLPEDVAFLAQSVDDERIIPVPPKGPPEPGAKTAEKTPEAHLPDGAYREPPAPKFDTVANVAMSLLAELDALAVDPLLARLMPLRDAAAREDPWSREDLLLMRGVFNTLGHIQFKRLGLDKKDAQPPENVAVALLVGEAHLEENDQETAELKSEVFELALGTLWTSHPEIRAGLEVTSRLGQPRYLVRKNRFELVLQVYATAFGVALPAPPQD